MTAKTPAEKEEVRHAVRTYLYDRQRAAQTIATITRNLRRDGTQCDEDDVEIALAFLTGMDQVAETPDPLGSTKYFKLTATGILDHERSGAVA